MDYAAPLTIREAVQLLAAGGPARVLAGGTDLLPQLRSRRPAPELIVDIKKIPETRQISIEADRCIIGAAVSGAELSEHPELKVHWPGLVEAADLIGSTQIQGRATLGGNLCNASPAADAVPALIAAAARCRLAGPHGEREMAVEDIILSPGKTCLQPGEFLVSFVLAPRAERSGDAYLRMTPRTEMDIAVVGAGVRLSLDERGICIGARVALGAVAPAPLLVESAAQTLLGTELDEATLKRLSTAVRNACRPITDKRGTAEYRSRVAGVLASRAAAIARQRAECHTGGKPT